MVCNDHRLYTDDEITFGDVIRAEELIERARVIAKEIRSKKNSSNSTSDKDLTEAVKRLLDS